MFQNYVRNSIVLHITSGEEETGSHLLRSCDRAS